MKKILRLFLAVLCFSAMLFSSCTATESYNKDKDSGTEKGQEGAGDKDKEQGNISDTGYGLTPWEEIKAKEEEYPELLRGLTLEKMTISDSLSINIPEEVRTGNYIIPSGFEERYEEIFFHYVDDYDEANLIDEREKVYPSGFSYVDEKKKLRLAIGCTGFFTYTKGDFDMQMYVNESELVKTYAYTEAMNTDDAYKLTESTGEVSVSYAAAKAQSFADDFVSFCNYPHGIRVSRISLYKCEKGYFYVVQFTQSVSGVNTLEYHPVYDKIYENLVAIQPDVHICSEEINDFAIRTIFNEYKIGGKLEKTMDLTDAAMYLDEKLAKNLHPEIKRIAFAYCMVRTDNIQEVKEGEKTDREKAPWAVRCSYDLFDAKPCWIFYFNETDHKENYAVIDCTDMEVYYVDNKGAE